MIQERELLEKVDEWQHKAGSESDPFNRYVSSFIAYNIFYNLLARKRAGRRRVDFTRGDSRRATATISLVNADELFPLIESDLRLYARIIQFSEKNTGHSRMHLEVFLLHKHSRQVSNPEMTERLSIC